jgi:hypothetical protein
MIYKQQVTAILNKKMDRKDFIKNVAIGMVALTGAGAVLRLLAPAQSQQSQTGYGGSAYGGSRDSQ